MFSHWKAVQLFFLSFLFPAAIFAQEEIPFPLENILPETRQVILVQEKSSVNAQGQLTAWEYKQAWQKVLGPIDVTLGRNGVAEENQKREGDGRTPSGIFELRRAFGYLPSVETELAYTQVQENDFWIDDPESAYYNQWVKEAGSAKSFECLKREDDLYKYTIIVEYNTSPVIAGHGSAIFFHIWRGPDKPTAGCIAMEEKNILKLLNWLDQNKNPAIYIRK